MLAAALPIVFKCTRTHSFCAKNNFYPVTSQRLISYRDNIAGIIGMALGGGDDMCNKGIIFDELLLHIGEEDYNFSPPKRMVLISCYCCVPSSVLS